MSPGSRVVTIDGPAGVGKSTVGRSVARRLRLPFVDTGLFYRALTVAARRGHLGVGQGARLERLARELRIEVNTDPSAAPDDWQARLGEERLGAELWDRSNSELLAFVARQPEVRRALLPLQRRPAARGAVLVGRDTGTVVCPGARCKIYLDAPVEVRLGRRRRELELRGEDSSEAVLRADVLARDATDRSRELAPLRVPETALAIATEGLSAQEVVDLVLAECRRCGLGPALPDMV